MYSPNYTAGTNDFATVQPNGHGLQRREQWLRRDFHRRPEPTPNSNSVNPTPLMIQTPQIVSGITTVRPDYPTPFHMQPSLATPNVHSTNRRLLPTNDKKCTDLNQQQCRINEALLIGLGRRTTKLPSKVWGNNF